jgi:hypothetical protein
MAVKHMIRVKSDGTMEEKVLTRAEAIHYHCVECCGFNLRMVGSCPVKSCALWPYRTGSIDMTCVTAGSDKED